MRLIIVAIVMMFAGSVLALDMPSIQLHPQGTTASPDARRSLSLLRESPIIGYNIYVDGDYHETVFTRDLGTGGAYVLPQIWCSFYVAAFDNVFSYSPRSNEVTNQTLGVCGNDFFEPQPPIVENPSSQTCVETIVRVNGVELGRDEQCY